MELACSSPYGSGRMLPAIHAASTEAPRGISMAGFCRNCGTALGEGQAFCVQCGTRVGDTSPPSAAPPVSPAPPVAAAPPAAYVSQVPAAPPAASGTSALVKILIGVVIVFVVFGLFAAATVIYIGHR